ncbi:MAG: nucleotidyltransferase substrate binding protein [Exilispira sp.]|jgi:nucleotidyltransferase substrate binding protein (TIGR01987 family)|nr:nucleotidyltransferase substrate binding protein [Exilispira sp.]
MQQDIRWKQRFSNFQKAFTQLREAVELSNKRELTDLEKQGVIQSFEYTYELSWNMIRDYLIYKGIIDIVGSRDAIKLAYKYGILKNGEIWIEMINSRNLTTHTYNKKIVDQILDNIIQKYWVEFKYLYEYFENLVSDSGNDEK